MLNKQKFTYEIREDSIPISKYLSKLIKDNKIKKSNVISNGDDYQVLFTAKADKARIIERTAANLGIKITKIGKINSAIKNSSIIGQKGKKIVLKDKGYIHKF